MDSPENILSLKTLVKVLLERISTLEVRTKELEDENAALKTENAALKARLGLNSQNSSKPPSSDGLRKKPAFPREKNGKRGGVESHEGKTLEMVANPDYVVKCIVERCGCGCDLSNAPAKFLARRQEFEMPPPRLEITEYQTWENRCPRCGQVHRGLFPAGISAPTQYGNRVKGLLTLLTEDCALSFEKAQTLFCDLYGYPINESTIQSTLGICYTKLQPVEELIEQKIIAAPTVNVDETGGRCQGRLHWFHVASTSLFTYLFAHAHRGKEAIESMESILGRCFGWVVHDCWPSYFNLSHVKHALCGAHLLRELQAQIDNKSQWATVFHAFLLATFRTDFAERIKTRTEIEAKFDSIILQGQEEEPPPEKTRKKGKIKRTKGRNLLERLQKYKSDVLAFAFNSEVPFTNNQAERDLRPVKVKLKVSGCFRTFAGAQHYARIAGFISTVRKNNLNVFNEICNVFAGKTSLLFHTS